MTLTPKGEEFLAALKQVLQPYLDLRATLPKGAEDEMAEDAFGGYVSISWQSLKRLAESVGAHERVRDKKKR